jgi:hypothetical protein
LVEVHWLGELQVSTKQLASQPPSSRSRRTAAENVNGCCCCCCMCGRDTGTTLPEIQKILFSLFLSLERIDDRYITIPRLVLATTPIQPNKARAYRISTPSRALKISDLYLCIHEQHIVCNSSNLYVVEAASANSTNR